ncbi:MAG TPA: hypothetical protein VKQ36_06960 [Ktedonobacterales bacterium]|nr:hypothetical protein [Ktedonobacterales bacterium]
MTLAQPTHADALTPRFRLPLCDWMGASKASAQGAASVKRNGVTNASKGVERGVRMRQTHERQT